MEKLYKLAKPRPGADYDSDHQLLIPKVRLILKKVGKLTRQLSESEVAQSCPTLCDSVDCSPPGSYVHGILQARNGVGFHFLLQLIFPPQGSNPGLPHCRQTL